ncbi:TIGR03364 family FAD-dependent oxidoreductase [Rathayibacter sp. YIM 133350]|uniref:TIGR03364 family FAD-dependent oxidoreductase n=1 Tax=Rathayibacter sp. YIM 133350 TaxID=3131992 RepID=UPI003FD15AB8
MAWHAVQAGLRVVVLERDAVASGASVRNFGHICTSAQAGRALEFALDAREEWLRIGREAGIVVRASGTVVVARTAAELAVLEEFAATRDGLAEVLDAPATAARSGFSAPGTVGGAFLPLDLRIDAPSVIPALTAHLIARGVDVRFGENVLEVTSGSVRTTRGKYAGERVVVAVGHDVDRLFPQIAEREAVLRCRLRMLEVAAPGGLTVTPGIFTGLSLLRYEGFSSTAAATAVRDEIAASAPELLDHTVNLMFTQRPDGRLVIGDSHHYENTLTPFEDDRVDELLLSEFRRLLDVDEFAVLRRWRGVYASSVRGPYLIERPEPGVTVASITSGIGMTTALGLARSLLASDLP